MKESKFSRTFLKNSWCIFIMILLWSNDSISKNRSFGIKNILSLDISKKFQALFNEISGGNIIYSKRILFSEYAVIWILTFNITFISIGIYILIPVLYRYFAYLLSLYFSSKLVLKSSFSYELKIFTFSTITTIMFINFTNSSPNTDKHNILAISSFFKTTTPLGFWFWLSVIVFIAVMFFKSILIRLLNFKEDGVLSLLIYIFFIVVEINNTVYFSRAVFGSHFFKYKLKLSCHQT